MGVLSFFKNIRTRTQPNTASSQTTVNSPSLSKSLHEYFERYPNPEPDPMCGRAVSTMGKIAAYSPVLVRFIKTSDMAAEHSLEGWARIPTYPNSISSVGKDDYPLSITSQQCALNCLGYGDAVAYIPVNADVVTKYGLQDEPIWWTGNIFDEYNARRFYVSDVKSLFVPETLRDLIRSSSDTVLKSRLMDCLLAHPVEVDVLTNLTRQGCYETAQFWRYLQEYFVSHVERNEFILAARDVQSNIDSLYEEWQQEQAKPFLDDDFGDER